MARRVFLMLLLGHLTLQAKDNYIHVFVHGTTLPGFLLLNQTEQKTPIKIEERFVSFVEKSRDDERFYDDSIMLGRGLVQVGQPLIAQCRSGKLDSYLSRRAAIQAITAYDEFVDHRYDHYYYLYGWSGLLSDDCRKKEAEKLYQELIALKKKFSQAPIFILHSHSHGGNIILYLALQEELNKQGLVIEQVVFYEMPVQNETAKYCLSPIFKQVVFLYSEGDVIQIADHFSTAGKSYRTLSEFISLNGASNKIQEVLVKINGDHKLLKHRTYFFFDAYYSLSNAHRDFFIKNEALNLINPLPLIIFSPVFLSLLVPAQRKSGAIHCELDIRAHQQVCIFQVTSAGNCQHYSTNMWPAIKKIKDRIAATWRPYAKTSDLKKLIWLGQHIILRSPLDYIKIGW